MVEEVKKKRVVVESLGWLTESSIMPKKHKAIEGVGASSILELKAELYKSQEEAKKSKEPGGPDINFHRAKAKIAPRDTFSLKNSGVDARERKDKLELKAEKDGSASYAALERKAELYEKLARGELSDEEDEEKYCVDFFRKSLCHENLQQPRIDDNSFAVPPQSGEDESVDTFFSDQKLVGLGRTTGSVDHDEHKRFVREVHEEVSEARQKASELKLRRQEQANSRRERLKQAYIMKQLEKLKAAGRTEQT